MPTEIENATVAIIGGGPHALAVLSALHERSYASPQFKDDAAYALRVGFDSHKLVGSVAVIDPGKKFCDMWHKRFLSLGIDRLRSPVSAHPDAYDEHALLNFAICTGRTAEITHPEGAEISRDNIQRSPMGFGFTLHGQPSAALFRDFCDHLADKHPHTWVQGTASSVAADAQTGKYRVQCGDDRVVLADAVVLATGPQGRWNVPEPFKALVSSPTVVHTSELFDAGCSLGDAVLRRTTHLAKGAKVLVVGGGLTAAQAALAAVRAGFRVSLRSREALRTRDYDVQTEWLDRRHVNRLRFEFLSTPMEKRAAFLRQATGGGSIPQSYLEELHDAVATTSRLDLCVDADIERASVQLAAADGGDGVSAVTVDGETFGLVILATGVTLDPSSTSLYRNICNEFPASFVGGFPELDDSLRWSPDEDIFVVGCNAGLQLGPGALNLMGSMRSGQIVAEELHDLIWKDTRVHRTKLEANLFSMLCVDGDTTSESENEDEE
eukprot:m.179337 g.179337  ORF g.179337 m.179337 type:complete len:495 (+) comp14739_c0_seq1:422-1906(+)